MPRVTPVLLLANVALALVALGCASSGGPKNKEVVIEVTEDGFTPAEVVIPKNEAVTLVVTRRTDKTCANEMVFAATGEKYDLPLNQTVRIELPAGQRDTLRYACGMDMYHGLIVAK